MLVGIPLAAAYLRTRALWMPIGIHFAWNFLQGFTLGLPVSGIALPDALVTARVHGAVWLTGGDYGPEGGLLASGAIVAVTFYMLLSKRIYTSEEMKALVFGRSPAVNVSGEGAAPPAPPSEQAPADRSNLTE